MNDSYQVLCNLDGSAEIHRGDGTLVRLNKEQCRAYVSAIIQQGFLKTHVAALSAEGTREGSVAVADQLTSLVAGDVDAASAHLSQTLQGLLRSAGVRPNREPDKTYVPEVELLIPAAEAGAALLRTYPTATAAADVDAERLRHDGRFLGVTEVLLKALEGSVDQVRRGRAPVARATAQSVREVLDAVSPFVHRDTELARLAVPLDRFVHEAVERGQVTKELLARTEQRVRAQVTAEIYARAREEARAELRTQLGDKVKILTEESATDKAPKK